MSNDTSALPARMLSPNWYGEQDDNGVDLSLIRENLKLTPVQRLRRGDQATTDALRLREHVQKPR